MSTSRTREKADGELFKSTGIDDNATSNAITIDSSERVVIGATVQAAQNAVTISSAGYVQARATGVAGYFDRIGSDGSVLEIRKSGAAVGSIGTNGSRPYLTNPTYGGISVADYRINPVNASGAAWDNALNLGAGGSRWKDLYLSGGVYLGGTGAANKLDDYEEGTWTPSFGGSTSNPTVNFNVAGGTYVKVGRLVTIGVKTTTVSVSGGSGGLFLNGLPFARSTDANYGAVAGLTQNFNALPSEPLRGYLSTDYIRFKYGNAVDVPTSVLRTSGDSNQIWMSFTYETES